MILTASALSLFPRPTFAQGADDELVRTARLDDARSLGVGRTIADLEVTPMGPASGATVKKRTISSLLKDRKALVIAMTSATCPMCTKYAPRLAAMEDELAPRGVGFVFVNGVDAESPPEMARQVQKYRLDGPYLPDRDRDVARELGARTTTEVFLIDPARTLVYRGAVDDQYGLGTGLDSPRRTFLKDAIEALLAGDRPRVRATWSPGCLLDIPAAPQPERGPVAYSTDIAPILAENCVTCHRPGGAAPFALDTYDAVNGRAKMVEAIVRDGQMPPWHGAAHAAGAPSPWVNDRSLTQRDAQALLGWLGSERERGPERPPPHVPPISSTWAIGEPDLIATTSGSRLPAQGGIQHARVMVAFSPTEDKWVTAAEFRQVESNTVHHALVWLLNPGGVLPGPEQMPCGLELLGTFSPGDNILRYPPGMARRVRAGSVLLVDLYSRPMGKETWSSLRIAMKFARPDADPKWEVRSLSSCASRLDTQADGGAAEGSVSLELPKGAQVLSLTPYLRAGGSGYTIEAETPGAAAQMLLDAPRYDFRWVIRYEYVEPRELAAGSRLVMRARYGPASPADSAKSDQTMVHAGMGGEDASLLFVAEVVELVKAR